MINTKIYPKLHFNAWSLDVKNILIKAGVSQKQFVFNKLNEWESIDIDLKEQQLENIVMSSNGGTLYIDDMYFYDTKNHSLVKTVHPLKLNESVVNKDHPLKLNERVVDEGNVEH